MRSLIKAILRTVADYEFDFLGTSSSNPNYQDYSIDLGVEYCYYVTQIMDSVGTESDSSNHACATHPIGPIEVNGNVSGVWSTDINVTDNIVLQPSDTLIIQPGVLVFLIKISAKNW